MYLSIPIELDLELCKADVTGTGSISLVQVGGLCWGPERQCEDGTSSAGRRPFHMEGYTVSSHPPSLPPVVKLQRLCLISCYCFFVCLFSPKFLKTCFGVFRFISSALTEGGAPNTPCLVSPATRPCQRHKAWGTWGALPFLGCTEGYSLFLAAGSLSEMIQQLPQFVRVSFWILFSNWEESLNHQFNLKIKLYNEKKQTNHHFPPSPHLPPPPLIILIKGCHFIVTLL